MTQASDQVRGEAQPATCGRLILGAYTRRQSRPSNNAANCAADSRITPSLITGHLNFPGGDWGCATYESLFPRRATPITSAVASTAYRAVERRIRWDCAADPVRWETEFY